ncbi:MlaD family protein [Capnocytophaga catalasegens]|uniref:Organic solvent ABC transporter substrate-binding protein n=1 Tax=Capnocytophaga catalasegens TaxID=1004260 RepID=A0AAV5ASD0_9FLAO|nr:MlaD family protein [Capnocytophaga catalasegens]GIZ15039.1 organic solvent ABC transporter substrate-binding protein [Capnocytophaga catalasegens]GJM49419.1 organic solvent ABC transporter substrate-binding protein [Capnocytophaga catalasegens]GJM52569.1 organic solvent ABC transporter substrate-binding protein [Capnocytophaga catalasegens]
MKLSKEIKTAIIVLVGIACFIFGFNFLKSTPIFNTDNEYHAIFDHSGGLQVGTAVTVNGVIMGAVTKIKIDNNSKIVVTFTCKDDFTFSKNSKAEIYSSLLGNTGLQIVPVQDDAPRAKSGDYLPSSVQEGLMDAISSQLAPTSMNLNKMLTSSDSLIVSLSNTLDKKAQQDIKESLTSLNATLQSLNRASIGLEKLISTNKDEIEGLVKNANYMSNNFAKFSDTLSQVNIGKMVTDLQYTLNSVNTMLTKIEKGSGTLGLLMNDPKLYNNLKTASSELGLLVEDIRRNPKRYVHISIFGKKNAEYQTPDNVEPSISEREELLQPK